MPDRTCATPRCNNTNTPHRARIGSGHWCISCLDHWRRHDGDDPAGRKGLRPVANSCVVIEDGKRCGQDIVHKAHGWCDMHRSLARNNGSPTARQRTRGGGLLALVHAAAKATDDDCIIPTGWGQRPIVKLNGVMTPGARAVWKIVHGDPGTLSVLHTCNGGSGVHGCISIRHLYLGDAAQNSRDMVEAGRSLQGEQHRMHVLTEDDVHEIRRRHVRGTGPYDRGNSRDLAEEFGVCPTTIRRAVNGRTWTHLHEGPVGGEHRGD